MHSAAAFASAVGNASSDCPWTRLPAAETRRAICRISGFAVLATEILLTLLTPSTGTETGNSIGARTRVSIRAIGRYHSPRVGAIRDAGWERTKRSVDGAARRRSVRAFARPGACL